MTKKYILMSLFLTLVTIPTVALSMFCCRQLPKIKPQVSFEREDVSSERSSPCKSVSPKPASKNSSHDSLQLIGSTRIEFMSVSNETNQDSPKQDTSSQIISQESPQDFICNQFKLDDNSARSCDLSSMKCDLSSMKCDLSSMKKVNNSLDSGIQPCNNSSILPLIPDEARESKEKATAAAQQIVANRKALSQYEHIAKSLQEVIEKQEKKR